MSNRPFNAIAVIGAGTMGAHIALQCAAHGYAVKLYSRSEATLARAAQVHEKELGKRIAAKQISDEEKREILGRIATSTRLADALAGADLVIENAPEQLDVKRALFAEFERQCAPETVFATNSSSFRISLIEDAAKRPGQVLNMHFYQPVWQRAIVELMRGSATSDATMERAKRFVRAIGLAPLIVRKESTGFLFNRVWRAIKKECLHLVDDGVASFEDVDRAWMVVMGTPAGPFALMDVVGLDVVRDIEMVYYRESGDESDAPPKLLLDKIARGELGMKTGKGFYSYPNPAYRAPGWLKGEAEEGGSK